MYSHTTKLLKRMTSRNKNARSNTSSAPKPFCKVCKDAGKSEKEYTSHWVKSNDRLTGKTITTCPTLLAQECRYCRDFGHTAKYCQALADKKKYEEKTENKLSKNPKQVEEKKVHSVAKRVSFAALAYDSDEEVQVKPTPVISGPKPVTTAAKPVLTGWAAIAAKPVTLQAPVEPKSVFTELNIGVTRVKPVIIAKRRPAPVRGEKINWAYDYSSSDEEDDVEEMQSQQFTPIYDPTW